MVHALTFAAVCLPIAQAGLSVQMCCINGRRAKPHGVLQAPTAVTLIAKQQINSSLACAPCSYAGTGDAIQRIASEEGMAGFFKGGCAPASTESHCNHPVSRRQRIVQCLARGLHPPGGSLSSRDDTWLCALQQLCALLLTLAGMSAKIAQTAVNAALMLAIKDQVGCS